MTDPIVRPTTRPPVEPVVLAPWQKAEAQLAKVNARIEAVTKLMLELTYTDTLAQASEVYGLLRNEVHSQTINDERAEYNWLLIRQKQLVGELARLK